MLKFLEDFLNNKPLVEIWAERNARLCTPEKTMEDNEKKWQLAESLLGMVRNEFGALVPKEGAG